MSNDVNLLRNAGRHRQENKKLIWISKIVSVCILLVVLFFSFLFFFLNSHSQLPDLQKEESSLLSNLSVFHTKAVKLLLTENRIKEISSIMVKRSNFDTVITAITGIIPQEIRIQSFSLDKKNATIILSSSSLSSADRLFDNLSKMVNNNKNFSKITLEDITLDTKSSEYTFSLSFDLL